MHHKFKGAAPVGWSERDMIWLRAAVTLNAYDFLLAIEDISGMSGRTIGAVAQKARMMRREAAGAKTSRKVPIGPTSPPRHKRLRQRLVELAAKSSLHP